MDNLTAVRTLCNAIVSSFHPDDDTISAILFHLDIEPSATATPKDPEIFRAAVALVKGYVESSRSEGGISVSVMSEDAIKQSVIFWCGRFGLDADEELADYLRVIENGSNMW